MLMKRKDSWYNEILIWNRTLSNLQIRVKIGKTDKPYTENVKMNTLKCLSIGTLKTIDIPYIPNGKLVFLGVPLVKHIIIGL